LQSHDTTFVGRCINAPLRIEGKVLWSMIAPNR